MTEAISVTLLEAVEAKDVQLCQKLLIEGHSAKHKNDKDGFTILHVLVRKCSTAKEADAITIANLLLEHGANINDRDNDGNTPLHMAAREGHSGLCDAFTEYMKNKGMVGIKKKSKCGMTPLHLAAQNCHLKVITLLLDKGGDPTETDNKNYLPLHYAAEKGNVECCRILSKYYKVVDPDCIEMEKFSLPPFILAAKKGYYHCYQAIECVKNHLNYKDPQGNTALHIVAKSYWKSQDKFAVILLNMGADPNKKNNKGNTPMMEAVFSRDKAKCLSILMEQKNIDISQCNKDGDNIFHLAAARKAYECVELILEKKEAEEIEPLLNATNNEGLYPLCVAVQSNHDKCAIRLLDAHPSRYTVKSKLPLLHIAAENKDISLLEKLLALRQYDVNEKCKKLEETALHAAARSGSKEACLLLLRKNAQVDKISKNNMTPLLLSASNDHPEVLKLLLKHTKDKTAKNDTGCTALHLAVKAGSLKCCEILTEACKHLTRVKNTEGRYPIDTAFLCDNKNIFQHLLKNLPYGKAAHMPKDLKDHLHGYTHKVVDEHRKAYIQVIIESKWWEICFVGGSHHSPPKPCTNFAQLVKKDPKLAEKLMDNVKKTCESPTNCSSFDFRLYEQHNYYMENGEDPFNKTYGVKDDANELLDDPVAYRDQHPVYAMACTSQLRLLKHPLTNMWIKYKWCSYGRWIFRVQTFFHVLSVLTLVFFTSNVKNWKQINKTYNVNQEDFCNRAINSQPDCLVDPGVQPSQSYHPQDWNRVVAFRCHFLVLVVWIIRALLQMYELRKLKWCSSDRWLRLLGILTLALTLFTLVPTSPCEFRLGIKSVGVWQCGVVALLLDGFLLLHNFDKVSKYSIIPALSKKYILECVNSLVYIVVLLFFFAYIFHIVLGDTAVGFESLPQALMKTVVWTQGELGYDETFVSHSLLYPIFANILFFIFIFFVGALVVMLLKSPSPDNRNFELHRKVGKVKLLFTYDVCYPWLRKKCVEGKSTTGDKIPNFIMNITDSKFWIWVQVRKLFDVMRDNKVLNRVIKTVSEIHKQIWKCDDDNNDDEFDFEETVRKCLGEQSQLLQEMSKKLERLTAECDKIVTDNQMHREQISELVEQSRAR